MSDHPGRAAAIEALRARGVVPAESPPPVFEESQRPWFVSLLLGAAGWLAGVFLLVFIGLVFKPDGNAALIVLGLIGLGAAFAMYRVAADNAFLGQLALAMSMAGQISLAVGMLMDVKSSLLIASVLLALQLGVLAVMPDRTARTVAALFASIAWLYVVRFAVFRESGWDDFFEPMYDERLGNAGLAIGWVATWVPLVAFCLWLVRHESRWMAHASRGYLRSALAGVLVTVALGGFATEPLSMAMLGPGRMGVDLGWWSLFPLLSIALAVFAAWCAFRLGSRGLLGLAAAAALVHLGRFYYAYGTTLLVKSSIMLVIGALLLLGAYFVRQRAIAAGDAP